jgi:hypothetical protein
MALKKFSDIKRINEQEQIVQDVDKANMEEAPKPSIEITGLPKANLPENISQPEESGASAGLSGFDSNPSKLFSKLFESREMAHIYHLQVKGDEGSYAAHMALGAYYDGVLGLIDDLIETYQGQYDIIEGYDTIDTNVTRSKDKIEYFKELAEFIKTGRKCISPEDTHLHNIIDEIVALVYKTLYKLRFNR